MRCRLIIIQPCWLTGYRFPSILPDCTITMVTKPKHFTHNYHGYQAQAFYLTAHQQLTAIVISKDKLSFPANELHSVVTCYYLLFVGLYSTLTWVLPNLAWLINTLVWMTTNCNISFIYFLKIHKHFAISICSFPGVLLYNPISSTSLLIWLRDSPTLPLRSI